MLDLWHEFSTSVFVHRPVVFWILAPLVLGVISGARNAHRNRLYPHGYARTDLNGFITFLWLVATLVLIVLSLFPQLPVVSAPADWAACITFLLLLWIGFLIANRKKWAAKWWFDNWEKWFKRRNALMGYSDDDYDT